ncbi:putative F-box only protein 15 [Raphanus sativus]|uniref:F-box only protein 15 n=1 Tax=Raphanus sativus TaxID=3726 RepID=A0A9W3BZN7_RAPSA|nr:putative F-box only protein 15 [Raphanus sativus]KAJ4885896.1 putative F-box only protein 15 [Raphanus sativus]
MASSQRSWSLSSLPLDLIEEIFHRTPAESLLRSKPTCKKWRHLIDNKRFIYEHLRRFPEQRRFLRIDETVQIMDPVRRTRSETPIPYELQPVDNITAMVHCDGLMLCMCSDMASRFVTLSLWNPLTRHIALIQPSTRFTTSDHYGIGYGINKYRDGYKILRFSDRRYFEIYYCGTSSWRTLDDAEVDWSVDFRCQGVSVMGNMYWLAHRFFHEEEEEDEEEEEVESFILGFDFTAETFMEVWFCPPYNYDDENNYLSCFDGDRLSLLLQDKEVPSVIEVWVSSKLPDDVSFTKYFRVVSPGLPWLRIDRSETASHPVYYIAKSKRIVAWCENVVVLEGGRLPVCTILYEIDEGGVVAQHETERHEDNDYIGTFLCGYVYVPSLIPLP